MFYLRNKNKQDLTEGFTPLETVKFNKFLNLFKMIDFKKDKKNKNKFLTGFTLVEMITAVAIFSLVMIIAMGALLAVLNANKQNQAIQTAVNNLSLAMEMMSREIRVGHVYHCKDEGNYEETRNCSEGEDFFTFMSYEGDQVVFRYVLDEGVGRIQRSDDGGDNFLYLTAKAVAIERLTFYVVGTDISDDIQPRVLITVGGYVDLGSVGERGKSYFNLQTTISQRLVDF